MLHAHYPCYCTFITHFIHVGLKMLTCWNVHTPNVPQAKCRPRAFSSALTTLYEFHQTAPTNIDVYTIYSDSVGTISLELFIYIILQRCQYEYYEEEKHRPPLYEMDMPPNLLAIWKTKDSTNEHEFRITLEIVRVDLMLLPMFFLGGPFEKNNPECSEDTLVVSFLRVFPLLS